MSASAVAGKQAAKGCGVRVLVPTARSHRRPLNRLPLRDVHLQLVHPRPKAGKGRLRIARRAANVGINALGSGDVVEFADQFFNVDHGITYRL